MGCLIFIPDCEAPELVDCLPSPRSLPEGTYAYVSDVAPVLRWLLVETFMNRGNRDAGLIYQDWSAVDAEMVPNKFRAYALLFIP